MPRVRDYLLADDDADAAVLVAVPSGRVCDFQQLVDERVLVLNLGEFGAEVDYPASRRCERASEVNPAISRLNLGRVHRR